MTAGRLLESLNVYLSAGGHPTNGLPAVAGTGQAISLHLWQQEGQALVLQHMRGHKLLHPTQQPRWCGGHAGMHLP